MLAIIRFHYEANIRFIKIVQPLVDIIHDFLIPEPFAPFTITFIPIRLEYEDVATTLKFLGSYIFTIPHIAN